MSLSARPTTLRCRPKGLAKSAGPEQSRYSAQGHCRRARGFARRPGSHAHSRLRVDGYARSASLQCAGAWGSRVSHRPGLCHLRTLGTLHGDLVPVVAVLTRERSTSSLVQLFAFFWFGNLIGCAIMAALLFVPDAIGEPIRAGHAAHFGYKLALPLPGLFVSAVLAGLVMTALTWVLLALRNTVGTILAILAGGYVLFGANLSHSIIGPLVCWSAFPQSTRAS
jgi:hypothetical protein